MDLHLKPKLHRLFHRQSEGHKNTVLQAFYLFQILKYSFQTGDIRFTHLSSKSANGRVCHMSPIVIGILCMYNYIVRYKIIIIKHKGWINLQFEYTSVVFNEE